jgi:hypothetical protein
MNQRETRIDEAPVLEESRTESVDACRREFLRFGPTALAVSALVVGEPFLNGGLLMAAENADQKTAMMTVIASALPGRFLRW